MFNTIIIILLHIDPLVQLKHHALKHDHHNILMCHHPPHNKHHSHDSPNHKLQNPVQLTLLFNIAIIPKLGQATPRSNTHQNGDAQRCPGSHKRLPTSPNSPFLAPIGPSQDNLIPSPPTHCWLAYPLHMATPLYPTTKKTSPARHPRNVGRITCT